MNCTNRIRSSVLTLATALGALASGCVVNNPPPPPEPGDITFQWSFDGVRSCSEAGVEEVDVQVVQGNEVLFFRTVECFGGGLTLTDFSPDSYELLLDAYSRSGRLLYQGDAVLRVQAGRDNDIGVVTLRRVGAEAGLSAGEAALYWSFRYPTDDSVVTSCLTAGVEAVHLEVVPISGGSDGFVTTLDCYDEGVVLEGLGEGRYTLFLDAEGSYQGGAIHLYEGAYEFDVQGGRMSDLGDLVLERVFESFADIEVSWEMGSSTCDQLGVDDVTFVITRMDGQLEDDALTVECDREYVLRETFVPGSYFIEAFGTGYDGEFYGSVTRNVAPNTTAETHLQLVLAP